MNTYLVQYTDGNGWIPFWVKSDSIYEVEAWVKTHVQRTGIAITNLEGYHEV